jgi:hypothetical protein
MLKKHAQRTGKSIYLSQKPNNPTPELRSKEFNLPVVSNLISNCGQENSTY